jgi:hypothetical protein
MAKPAASYEKLRRNPRCQASFGLPVEDYLKMG